MSHHNTFNMQSGTGATLTFARPLTQVSVTARAEVYVQPVYDGGTIAAPGADPAPSGGASAAYVQLTAGESVSFDITAGIAEVNARRRIIGLNFYPKANGMLVTVGA